MCFPVPWGGLSVGRATSWGPCSSPEPPRAGLGGAWSPGGDVQLIWGQIFPKSEPWCHQQEPDSSSGHREEQDGDPVSPGEEQEGEWMSLWEEWDGECVSPSQAGGHRGAQRGGTRVNPTPEAPRDLGSLPAVTPIPACAWQ